MNCWEIEEVTYTGGILTYGVINYACALDLGQGVILGTKTHFRLINFVYRVKCIV